MSDPTDTIFTPAATAAPTEPVPTALPPAVEVPAQPPVTDNPYADLLGGIKTDDGRMKYATVSDALTAIPHAQGHISTLEAELTKVKEELSKRVSVEESLQQLANKPETTETTPPVGLGEQEIAKLFDQRLQARDAQHVAEANQKSVANTLRESFGDKAEEAYTIKAAELGVDVAFLNTLAAKSPTLVLEYFSKAKGSAPQPTTGSISTAALGTTSTEVLKKQIMFGADSGDLVSEWNRCRPIE